MWLSTWRGDLNEDRTATASVLIWNLATGRASERAQAMPGQVHLSSSRTLTLEELAQESSSPPYWHPSEHPRRRIDGSPAQTAGTAGGNCHYGWTPVQRHLSAPRRPQPAPASPRP